ncbi:aminotransferase class III-fold pyridoxal phosphate-dependent enzyme, partial [Burkholderia cenocepacia]|uniref:aminotransferase class III-fold pyridoxal phosphate-dependent enzyme n=1 Tax=Burkholderia cenocepacia TaxID=95486 RepID=UPI0028550D7E
FIGEPFQGAGGVIFPPSTYWPEIQRICRKYDILLVADEVIGGFGRTGEWFAHQHFGFEPDLITMAKGLTSGYVPMGAVGIHERVARPTGAGLVAGVQLARDRSRRERFGADVDIGTICRDFCFNGNLIMRATGDRMLLSPPLVISRQEIDELVSKAKKAVDATAQQLGIS